MPEHRPPGAPLDGPVQAEDTFYGYFIDSAAAIAFIVLFSVTGLLHIGQSIYYKVWWLTPTFAACALGEVLGWAGREWSSKEVFELNAFLMQICCTIIAPSFMAAGLFFILGAVITRVGLQYVWLSPRLFSTLFISCDLIALVVQAVGGANASISFQNGRDPERGAQIMVGGIIFQIVAVTLYVITAVEFLIRWRLNKPVASKVPPGQKIERPKASSNIIQMLLGMLIATVFLYIRSIYRTIELLDGWTGPIIRNQNLFNYLDALPIFLALFVLNIFNPGHLLFQKRGREDTLEDDGTITSPISPGGAVEKEQV